MKVANLEQMTKKFHLDKTRGEARRVLFYLALLGNLKLVTVHNRDSHRFRLESLGLGQPLYHDWVRPSSVSCESSKDETRMLAEVTCPECLAFIGYRSSVFKEF